jgi:uncharacterized membrane-anchored protein YhcB (DUF1043 family)
MRRPFRFHDVSNRESLDKLLLGLAFAAGVGGGITLKLLAIHPFIAAAYSALVLTLYALLSYSTTSLRLEPEVIGDNSYYLGFLFTLTSLAVTLYFVVEAGPDKRAELIPEVISGFGVALVSTIVGVFIRVLMMQFRLDLVSRERETRIELDDVARRLRVELAHTIERVKAFTVESFQHSAERESEFRRTTEELAKSSHSMLAGMAITLQEETSRSVREQTISAIETIRTSIKTVSEAALTQIQIAFEDMANIADQMNAAQLVARTSVEKSILEMQLHGSEIAEKVANLSLRFGSIVEEAETAGANLAVGINRVTAKLEASFDDLSSRLGAGFSRFDQASLDAVIRSQAVLAELNERLESSASQLAQTATVAAEETDRAIKEGFSRFDQASIDAVIRAQAVLDELTERLQSSASQLTTMATAAAQETDLPNTDQAGSSATLTEKI